MTQKPNQQDDNVLPSVPIYRTIPGIPDPFKWISDTLFSKKPVKNEEIEQVTKHIYETRVKDRSIDDLLLSNHPDWVDWDDQDVDEVFDILFTVKDYKKYRNFKF